MTYTNETVISGETRDRLEHIGDQLETIGRTLPQGLQRDNLFALSWDVKQEARRGTPSEGI